jgi:hypothetical protein
MVKTQVPKIGSRTTFMEAESVTSRVTGLYDDYHGNHASFDWAFRRLFCHSEASCKMSAGVSQSRIDRARSDPLSASM